MSMFDIYVIDAFTSTRFGGNAAAVVVIPSTAHMDEETMQKIASEVNLPMTAFIQAQSINKSVYTLTWFNPTEKAAFCGHATLAAGHVLLNITEVVVVGGIIEFDSPVGVLGVSKRDTGELVLRFPSSPSALVSDPPTAYHAVTRALLGTSSPFTQTAKYFYAPRTNDLVILLDGISRAEFASQSFAPASAEARAAIQELNLRVAVFVARSRESDADSLARVFHLNDEAFSEDMVTGSAHTIIAPLFHELFGMQTIRAHQCSKREGRMVLELQGDQVLIAGRAVTVIQGKITI
ncbi:hypothetical protein IWW50_000603 [Coemansia erecta]|nr:hypothetical protein GGF43_000721 [Coemansia sp. RSA 2618]KAJ2829875.1 hypothetical protein IWW50_000603 [Coemansia erecta]